MMRTARVMANSGLGVSKDKLLVEETDAPEDLNFGSYFIEPKTKVFINNFFQLISVVFNGLQQLKIKKLKGVLMKYIMY